MEGVIFRPFWIPTNLSARLAKLDKISNEQNKLSLSSNAWKKLNWTQFQTYKDKIKDAECYSGFVDPLIILNHPEYNWDLEKLKYNSNINEQIIERYLDFF